MQNPSFEGPAQRSPPQRRSSRQRLWSYLAAMFFLLAATGAMAAVTHARPNVIFILTDDQGWGDARFAGHPYLKTPNLDRLAREGTWFRQFYVAATVCSPSRAAFMTSHAPARHQIHGHFATHEQNAARYMPDWLDPKAITITALLQQNGYATGHFGKWHLGLGAGAPTPGDYGIDQHKTVNSQGPSLGDESKDPYFRAQSTRLMIDAALQFIQEHRDRPFYINLWTLVPHAKLNPTPEELEAYAQLEPTAAAFDGWMREYTAAAKDLKAQMRTYCAAITGLDTQIGRLLDTLDEWGLTDKTLIFFSSDNGPEDYHIGNASNAGVGSPGPLRARKRSMYEGGIRTFGIARWPGRIAAGRVDATSVIGAVDWLPTICKLANVNLPATLRPDGEDVSDIWLGTTRPRRRPLFWEWLFPVAGPESYHPPMLAIRDGAWKLLVNPDGRGAELYEIPADIMETNNVAAQHPEITARLTAAAIAWQKSLPPSPLRDQIAAGKPLERPRKHRK